MFCALSTRLQRNDFSGNKVLITLLASVPGVFGEFAESEATRHFNLVPRTHAHVHRRLSSLSERPEKFQPSCPVQTIFLRCDGYRDTPLGVLLYWVTI